MLFHLSGGGGQNWLDFGPRICWMTPYNFIPNRQIIGPTLYETFVWKSHIQIGNSIQIGNDIFTSFKFTSLENEGSFFQSIILCSKLKIIHPMRDRSEIMRSTNLTFSWVRAPPKEIFFFWNMILNGLLIR